MLRKTDKISKKHWKNGQKYCYIIGNVAYYM